MLACPYAHQAIADLPIEAGVGMGILHVNIPRARSVVVVNTHVFQ